MEKYIQQLLADIAAAERKEIMPDKTDYSALYPEHPAASPEYEGELDYLIAYDFGERYEAEKLLGIPSSALPTADKLSEGQMELLVPALLRLLDSHHVMVGFPEGGAITTCYAWLLNFWHNPDGTYQVPVLGSNAFVGYDTCNFEPEGCKWGSACACRSFGE